MSADAAPLAMLQAWVNQHPRYAYTTDAFERTPGGDPSSARFRVSVDSTTTNEIVHVLQGKGAGSDLHWSGGSAIDARGPGFMHMLSVRMSVRDPRILSPRGNDIRTAVFSRVMECYVANADRVREHSATPAQIVLTLSDERGVACGDEYGPEKVTADRLTLDASDGRPLMRERLSGATVVERWKIEDLQTKA